MLLSIITPCFNAEKHITDCLLSVRRACQGIDYEHIVVDGGSADGTIEILKKQNDITWFSEKDNGMYDALNKGIALSRGLVVGHLNSDEQYNRKGLLEALSKMRTENSDGVLGPTVMLNGQLEFLQLLKQVIVPRLQDVYWHMPIQSCSFLYKRVLWEHIPYDTKYRLVADHVWFRSQMESGIKLTVVPKPIGIFTWHPNSLSNTKGKTNPEDALPDINKKSFKLKLAKHYYRLRKWLAGGYKKEPISFEYFKDNQLQCITIQSPVLKVRPQVQK
ncbi:MAG: hypothetical protein A2007_02820 [Verrucomicrobia bacterium GWC2_42_7]|nr:MAG: hypothetical protein A2007_02820 [Verrucomicrobia bacterium GWC2_42_7]